MNYLGLALRNLARNTRRSIVTTLSIAFGVAAIALFAGYTQAMYLSLRNMAVHGELLGQLTLARPGWQTRGRLEPRRFLIPAEELSTVEALVKRDYPEARVIPRLALDGLLANGNASTIFIALGIDPRDLQVLLGPLGGVYRGLAADKPAGISMAEGLAEMLGLDVGDQGVVLVSTIDGQANASDIEVTDRVNTGTAATNDKFVLMPIELARSLKNVDGASEWITVLLDDVTPAASVDAGIRSLFEVESRSEQQVEEARATLEKAVAAAGLDLEVSSWRDLSTYYNQVRRMYDLIFTLLLCIVLVIVVLSIANAMGMSVIERTREIGTLRAMGLRRRGVMRLFAAEALVLVIIGSVCGVFVAAVAGRLITAADIRYVPPGSSVAVPVYIGFDSLRVMIAVIVLGALSLVAAYLPARKAARQPIMESLTHA